MQLVLNELVTEIVIEDVVLGIRTDRAKSKFRTAASHDAHQVVDVDDAIEATAGWRTQLAGVQPPFEVRSERLERGSRQLLARHSDRRQRRNGNRAK